jgi:hypothetical protein
MTWFRLDDNGTFHPKVVRARNEAWGAFCRAGQWCAKHLTDGIIPRDVALAIAPQRVWIRLISVGFLEENGPESYRLHDYLDWNLPAVEVKAERDRKALNIRALRARRKQERTGHVTGSVTGYVPRTEPAGNHGPYPEPDPKRNSEENGTAAPAAHTHSDPEVVAIRDRIRHWPIFASLNADRLADEQAGWMMSKGLKLAWVLDAIDAAAAHVPDGSNYQATHSKLVSFMRNARKPRVQEEATPRRVVESKEDPALIERARVARIESDKRIAERLAREAAAKAGAK